MYQVERPTDVDLEFGRHHDGRIGARVRIVVELSSVLIDVVQLSNKTLGMAQWAGSGCIPYANDDLTQYR